MPRIETTSVHAGRSSDPATGALTAPIHLSTTFERGADGEYPRGFSYSREGNPNRLALEQCIAALEGGKEALAFASGLAVAATLMNGLEPGDHVLLPKEVYYGLRQTMALFRKWPIEITYTDMDNCDAVRTAVRPETRLIWIETPSNPLLKVTDLPAVAKIARAANAITVCDSTFATPVFLRPFDYGIDMVTHSTTKYFGGHSDVTGGVLVTKYDNYLFERARNAQQYGGAVPSPFDCWLTLRGISTLPCRVRAQSENAQRIALYLAKHPRVEVTHYPGLPGHPGHEIASSQMNGSGAMLSFQVQGGRDEAMGVAARVRLFTRATSLGGTHSLIEHRASVEGRESAVPQNLLRLSIGLEHADDLIADLEQAIG